MDSINWRLKQLTGKIRGAYFYRTNKYLGNKYAGRQLRSAEEGNDLLYDMIISGKPFAASRFGYNEISAIMNSELEQLKVREYDLNNNGALYGSAGFFPNEKWAYDRYYKWHKENIHNIDLLAVWFNTFEDYVIEKYMPETQIAYPRCLEPYYFGKPWSMALEKKKVLVISPFSKTIQKQHKVYDKLFTSGNILPEFELKTIKAVQTIGTGGSEEFSDWFEALDSMTEQMKKIDFDIAILGCGAYAIPLAIEAKKMGKQAIHMGGPTQILFGIKGKRWDENPIISGFYNEYWVRPSESERPKDANSVEDGCYW